MIGYVTLGTNNLPRAVAFYDALLGILGAERGMESDRYVIWSAAADKPGLGVIVPYDGKPATVGNGTMVALAVERRDKVDAVHRKALELGGSDEGAPGLRGETFYAGYFRDLDGNKLNVFCVG
ncbi:MAG: VOC family protein [Rudaea sp.]